MWCRVSAKNAKPSVHICRNWCNHQLIQHPRSMHLCKHSSTQHSRYHPPAPIQRHERIRHKMILQRVLVASRGVRGVFGVTRFSATYGSIGIREPFRVTQFCAIKGSLGIRGYSTDVAVERSEPVLFDAILMAKSSSKTMKSLKHDAKKSLVNALEEEEPRVTVKTGIIGPRASMLTSGWAHGKSLI